MPRFKIISFRCNPCHNLNNHTHTRQGYLCVFSLVEATSFKDMQMLYEQIIRGHAHQKPAIILVGMKVDLHAQRKVTTLEAKALASMVG